VAFALARIHARNSDPHDRRLRHDALKIINRKDICANSSCIGRASRHAIPDCFYKREAVR
jgi:tRNA(Phe) wybutosine-synthesizing methylase Tyw3